MCKSNAINTRKKTREQWLMEGARMLEKEVFNPAGYKLPKGIRITMSRTESNRKTSSKTLGVCMNRRLSSDNTHEILMNLELDNPIAILDVLAHELIHTICFEDGHGNEFRKIALAIGLEGQMRSTTAGEILTKKLKKIARKLGKFNHAKLAKTMPKDKARLFKVVCQNFLCGFSYRTTRTWIFGTMTNANPACMAIEDYSCPCCKSEMKPIVNG